MNKYLLVLLLAASTANAAPLGRVVGCNPGYGNGNNAAVEKALRALADAQADPADRLAEAQALADLADAVTTASGNQAFVWKNAGSGVQLIERARAIWTQAGPAPSLAAQLQARGRQDALLRRCALAHPVLLSALEMFDRTRGVQDPQSLEAVNDLLRVSLALDDQKTVSALAPRLLEGLDKQAGVGIGLADLYEDLGEFYYRTEENEKAESMARRSLELAKAASPQDPARIRRLTYQLASVYYAQLRFAEAEALLAQYPPQFALREPEAGRKRVKEQMAGMVHAGDLKGALAVGERMLGQYESELDSSQAARAEAEATYLSAPKAGPQHDKAAAQLGEAKGRANADRLNLARMQGYVGELHYALNELDAAEAMYLKARAQFEKTGAVRQIEAVRIATDLAVLYRGRGEPERALPLQEAALKAMLPALGSEHPDVIESQDELALLYKALKRYKDAEPLYVQRLQRAEHRGAGAEELAGELDALSEIAVAQGDTEKGEAYALRTVALWEQAGPAGKPQWRAAIGRLAKLYRDSGQADKAKAVEQRLAEPKRIEPKRKK
jgi:hypothetical protein